MVSTCINININNMNQQTQVGPPSRSDKAMDESFPSVDLN